METDDEASSEDKAEELLPPTVLEAETVYVVMGYNYRISRNRRAEWFFSMINTVIKVKPLVDLADLAEELTIVSVIPKVSDVEWGPESMTSYSYKICSETNINFLALKYRLVFCLDISPSVASVDVQAGLVMFDGIYHALHSSIENLVKPFRIPGSLVELEPRIYLTVIAHTPFLAPVADQVLVQGMAVTPQTVDEVLAFIFGKLAMFETKVAEVTASVTQTAEDEQARHHRMIGSAKDGMDRIVADNVAISSDFGFVDLLRQAIIALHLLPENSNAGIIVVTDGVISVPDGAFLDVILSQLRYNAVPCSFIQLSSPFHPHLCYGTIPYADFMRFVANATFGTYFTSVPDEISTETFEMNVFQQAFLSWSFLKVWEDMKMNIASTIKPGEWSVRNKCFFSVRDMPIVRKQQYETNLSVDYLKVLSCRLREGFTIRDVHISSDTAEIKLSLPWKFLNHIEYTVTTAIPSQTKVTCSVSVEGPYDFLHDLTCLAKKPFDSYYRQLMVNRFWTMQKFLSESDKLLVHFNSFSTDPAYYNVPDSLRDGVPLFYMQTSSTIPVISSSEFSSSQNQSSKFAQFWKPVCMLDTSIWQKWMHTHSIRMLLEHDSPLPISLHVPNTSGRYQVIQCRQAVMALNTFLKNWSSFVLVENSSYVKLMSHDSDKPPFSFYVIRVTSKPPFVVLRLAFLVGTPGNLRHEVVTTIREGLCQLSCLQRLKDPPQDWKNLTQSVSEGLQENLASRSPKKSWQVLCCTILQKPLEKILIRYERVPRNLLHTLLPQAAYYNVASPKSHAHQQSTFGFRPMFYTPWGSTIKMGPEMFNTVARYLHHKRWIWRIQNSSTRSLSLNCASQILSTLEKIRMQEGFQFAYSASGMASLVMELQMAPKSDSSTSLSNSCDGNIVPCVLQYVVFPPVNTLSSLSDEEDDVESESVEESGDLFVVSECWIEPQSGTVMENRQKDFSYMTGCEFTDIPVKWEETDFEVDRLAIVVYGLSGEVVLSLRIESEIQLLQLISATAISTSESLLFRFGDQI